MASSVRAQLDKPHLAVAKLGGVTGRPTYHFRKPDIVTKKQKLKVAKRRTTRMEKVSTVSANLSALAVSPDRVMARLKYVDQGTLDTSSTGYATWVYRLGSIFDPDYTGTGHQPTGYDQWDTFYSFYRVHSARVKVCVLSNGTTKSHFIACGPSSDVNGYIYLDELAEEPRTKFGQAIYSGLPFTYEDNFDLKALHGVTKEQFGDDRFGAAFGANPSDAYYFKIFGKTSDSSAASSASFAIEIEYFVEMYDRSDLAPSLWKKIATLIKDEKANSKPSLTPQVSQAVSTVQCKTAQLTEGKRRF